ncbi:MAG: hypothetical protein ABIK61_04540 [candidate division WOR-3 bacterium]
MLASNNKKTNIDPISVARNQNSSPVFDITRIQAKSQSFFLK